MGLCVLSDGCSFYLFTMSVASLACPRNLCLFESVSQLSYCCEAIKISQSGLEGRFYLFFVVANDPPRVQLGLVTCGTTSAAHMH